jgi:hypothetical protein
MNGSHELAHDKVLTFPCAKLSVFYKLPPPNPPVDDEGGKHDMNE